ncbi:hypothetical protein HNP84_009052 [Thermocatellispora tengchongensis]|uniref:Uncharacterized protein n=1 Tax=Thermocatellispora tengchongensis TaxID=1073253 RepID=A0A840PK03_9ACTN|nr:LxmA leader domain family RiPP [Thermocatellispora tengchongensis]MBB5139289.1 hypothetical protein [Thermocatellispora tengchongensis]
MKSAVITDLVAGYDSYVDPPELELRAAGDAPATTFICSLGVSWMSGQLISKITMVHGC